MTKENKLLLEKVDALYFSLEELFYNLVGHKKISLTPYVAKRMYSILAKYNDVKTELIKTYQIEKQSRIIKYDPLEPMFNLIIDALTLTQTLYQELLNENIDVETLFVLDNIMSRIQRTMLFFHYFKFVI